MITRGVNFCLAHEVCDECSISGYQIDEIDFFPEKNTNDLAWLEISKPNKIITF